MATVERIAAEVFPPGEFLLEELEARGWSQVDLADILGKDSKTVNEIVLGKRRVTPDMARLLSQALGTGANVWLNLENAYQLYRAERSSPEDGDVARRSELYQKYPVREMIRRGWIDHTENVDVLESQLESFCTRHFEYVIRTREVEGVVPLQSVWLHRTRHIAKKMQVGSYSQAKLRKALHDLRPLLVAAEEIKRVPEILRNAGVRFLVVEALPGSQIDGACFWLDAKFPVVAVSLRFDRIDHFWFTLLHELHHVLQGHGKRKAILDTDIIEHGDISEVERVADEGATRFLVPPEEMENFIARVCPLFSTQQIKEFSERVGMHMGIVVGQLQHRGLIGCDRNRNALVKVRNIVMETSVVDGWGVVA